MDDLEKKQEVLLSYSISSRDEKCGRDLLILQRGNRRAELDWFVMQRLRFCRMRPRSNKYSRFPRCRCFDYLQITTGLTSVSMFGPSSSSFFWLLVHSFLLPAQVEAKSKSAKAEVVNNMNSAQENYKNRRWWFSLLGVWTHKTQLSLTQKGGVYDSLQCL